MKSDISENCVLDKYFEWLRNVISLRLRDSQELSYQQIISKYPLPEVKNAAENAFNNILTEFKLNEAELLVLLLSLAPYYIPACLNSGLEEENNELKFRLSLNTSMVNKSNYPTIETAIILLGGSNITFRQNYYYLFSSNSKLFKENIISLPNPPFGEPFTRSNLIPEQNILNNILSGETKGPEFSHDFPATLLSSDYAWNDLVLDYHTRQQLEEIKEWIDYEDKCKKENLLIEKFKPGYKCLFHGPSGTGKTLAASLIGKLTGHRVYRIDLSAVVSKYIGETEKNLALIFDRASHGNWILFFDEADALFGKRGATQSAHDRYANQEVSYLLQRFELYEGVSILASNFKDNIDTAFYRRFHSIIKFKKPEAEERLKLWKVHLPKGFTYDKDIELDTLSRNIKVTGSGIYNIMRRSCMKAVLNGDFVITGKDIYESLKMEFAKENKTL